MTATTSIADVDTSCTWDTDFFCRAMSLLGDENQYITWILVFIGWGVAIGIAIFQNRSSNASELIKSKNELIRMHNEWVKEFRDKLEKLEDFSLVFWVHKDGERLEPQTALSKMTRECKDLTTIAQEIASVGFLEYQKDLFKELRKACTSDGELNKRPLVAFSYQVKKISETCAALKKKYKRINYEKY